MITELYQAPNNIFEISYTIHSHHVDFKVLRKYDMPDEVYLKGFVKWDGCSNWEIHDQVMFHACGKEGISELSDVMLKCWDITKRVLRTFDPNEPPQE